MKSKKDKGSYIPIGEIAAMLSSILLSWPCASLAAMDKIPLAAVALVKPGAMEHVWSGRAFKTDDCQQTVELGGVISTRMTGRLGQLFDEANVSATVTPTSASSNDVIFQVSIDEVVVDTIWSWSASPPFPVQSKIKLTLSAHAGEEEIWKRQAEFKDSFSDNGSMGCVTLKAGTQKHLEILVGNGIDALFDQFERDDSARTKLSTLSAVSGAAMEISDLQPLMATYRVVEAEGTVRKKPNAKGSAVKKLGMGSIVQVIGKLPTGWLQVAREGEAIGWIHEGSVTAMTVQQPAAAAPVVQTAGSGPAPVAAATFPTRPVAVSFKPAKPNPDDVAVIIGNANYKATAKDIPDVVPAYADAEGMKKYAMQALGIREENIIFIKDARLTDLVATFGSESNPKGKLWNWVKAKRSQVFVYYAGHGAPSGDGASSYLVPVDASASLIDLSGYSLKTLYSNLAKLPAKSVTVALEACFSGATQTGMLVKNASPIYQKAMQEIVPENITVITAGSGSQIASWEQDKSHSLFTKHFLLGMAGAADRKPHGNGDSKVTNDELGRYLAETVSYSAQRYYGREQTAQFVTAGK